MAGFRNLRISTKILAFTGFMALVNVAIAFVAVDTMRTYNGFNQAMVNASRRAAAAERVNGLINAVVMESRGVYMSLTQEESQLYADAIRAALARLKTEIEHWSLYVTPEQRETFEEVRAETRQFHEFRTELARLGTEVGAAAGRELGDNEANRINRRRLNSFIQQVAASDLAEIARLDAALSEFYRTRLPLIVGGSLSLLVVGLAGALLLARRHIARPLERLDATIERLAAGDTTVEPEGTDREDEVGRIARTLDVFKESLIAKRESETRERANLARLAEAREALARGERMASLGSLVAGVAHEVNTPLGVALTGISLHQEQFAEMRRTFDAGQLSRPRFADFLGRGVQALDLVARNLRRAAELIQTFKQVSVDQTGDQRRRFAVKEYLADVVESLQPAVKRTPHRVEVRGAADVAVDSYPGALAQIATNLVTNALMHAFDGRETPGLVTFDVGWSDARARILYRDDGCGMEAATLERILEPFFTTRRGTGGTGLGLTIIHNLVTHRLGGTMAMRSAPGEGLEIEFLLPRSAPVPAGEAADR